MDNIQIVAATVEHAREYHEGLQDLLAKVTEAEFQVQHTAEKAEEAIKEHFSLLIKTLTTSLQHRRDQLLADVSGVRSTATCPLNDSRQLIEEKLLTTMSVLEEGDCILKKGGVTDHDQLSSLLEKSATIGRLPEVQDLSRVANISVSFGANLLPHITSAIESHGLVLAFSPVQVSAVEERPGGLVVYWTETEDDEGCQEVHLFRLQCCRGNVRKDAHLVSSFVDVYTGSDAYFHMRDLHVNVPYSFQVSSCNSEDSEWKPWSQPYIAKTTLPHYEWESSNPCYMLTNEARISTRNNVQPTTVLLSKLPLQRCNHSILFRFLEVGKNSSNDEGLAFIEKQLYDQDKEKSFLQPGVIFINMEGVVFVDGKEMTTHLPCLKRGSSVIFRLESLESLSKLRISIERGDKQVMYDWKTSSNETTHTGIFFAMFFRQEGWKVNVE